MQTILVCDDDREIVEAIEIYLQQEGYHILKAYDGEEALQSLRWGRSAEYRQKREPASYNHGRDDAAA